jgi:glycyl-tRNA synthetase beta chain
LADKLDTLFGFFLSDQMPTGSKDPFALRRSAFAIISLISDNKLRLSIANILELYYRHWVEWWRAEDRYAALVDGWHKSEIDEGDDLGSYLVHSPFYNYSALDDIPEYRSLWLIEFFGYDDDKEFYDFELSGVKIYRFLRFDDFARSVLDFFADRLKVQQREAGVRHDLIDAIFALGGEDDLVRLLARVKALQAFVGTDAGANLLAGYKRAGNILKQNPSPLEGEGARRAGEGPAASAAEGLSGASAEIALGGIEPPSGEPLTRRFAPSSPAGGEGSSAETMLQSALDTAEPLATSAIEREDFEGAMSALSTLRAPIDAFFDGVMVNDPDPQKRAYRLGLLERFVSAVHRVADFSKIEG